MFRRRDYPLRQRGYIASMSLLRNNALASVVDLGKSPLANSFLTPQSWVARNRSIRSKSLICDQCHLCNWRNSKARVQRRDDFEHSPHFQSSS